MIQRIQSLYMLLLLLINIILISIIDSNLSSFLPFSYFGYFRIYLTDYFFSEVLSILFFTNIFLFKYSNVQVNILRFIAVLLMFGTINLFDERHILDSFKDPGLLYFIISLFLIFMTFKSIKKDQTIIKSLNRLR
ncbi:MAG: DUF4293 family protein [Bacteroidetes bacterium]|nr:DUF4293 family protein [Bacteroidota bacterium]MDA1019464.1 DUF4293 family protein [Bacteroidota bacterium]